MHELETNEFRNLTHDSYYVQSALKYSRSILVNLQGYLQRKPKKDGFFMVGVFDANPARLSSTYKLLNYCMSKK